MTTATKVKKTGSGKSKWEEKYLDAKAKILELVNETEQLKKRLDTVKPEEYSFDTLSFTLTREDKRFYLHIFDVDTKTGFSALKDKVDIGDSYELALYKAREFLVEKIAFKLLRR